MVFVYTSVLGQLINCLHKTINKASVLFLFFLCFLSFLCLVFIGVSDGDSVIAEADGVLRRRRGGGGRNSDGEQRTVAERSGGHNVMLPKI